MKSKDQTLLEQAYHQVMETITTETEENKSMISSDAEAKAKKQLESFNADLATLLAKYPDVKLVASFYEEVMAQIYTDERRGKAVSVYVPTQSAIQAADEKKGKQEANDQIWPDVYEVDENGEVTFKG